MRGKHRLVLSIVAAACLIPQSGSAADPPIAVVSDVQNDTVHFLVSGAGPTVGQRWEVFVDVPDVGSAVVATVVVTAVQQNSIAARIEQATGRVLPGQKVRPTGAQSPATAAVDPRDQRFPAWPTIRPDQTWIGESRWNPNQPNRVVVLCGVLKDGPAGKAGLRADDTILSIGGETLRTFAQYHQLTEAGPPGRTVEFEIERDGQTLKLPVTLEAMPPDGGQGRILAAAEAGESWAMMDIGVRYAYMRGNTPYFPKDDAEAVRWFRKSTETGYAAGPYFLAQMYQDGRGVERDYAEAVRLFEQARLDRGDGVHKGLVGMATNRLAYFYLNGWGVSKDVTQGLQLLRAAAAEKNMGAMYGLGNIYEHGIGVAQNYGTAIEYYQQAAEVDYAPAQYAIGLMAYDGRGVQQDYKIARGWFESAADLGHADAINKLGRMYAEGLGTPNDDGQAVAWFRKAADKGLAQAQDYLAFMYAQGRGVPKNMDEAVGWYRKAAAQGYAHAVESLKTLGVPLTPEPPNAAPATTAPQSTARATLGFLWIRVPEGYLVWGVLPDCAAAQAGLQFGDVVTHIDGVSPVGKLVNADAGPLGMLKDRRPGERVSVEFLRDGKPQTTNLVLNALPEDHGLARLAPVAEQGVSWALHAVGVVHYLAAQSKTGADAEREYAAALPWFFRGSAADFAWSHLLLANMYTAGHAVQKNESEAIAYYEKTRRAAKDRLDRLAANIASVSLGLRALNASPPDDHRALELIREAADNGSADGENILGWMYEKGRGLPVNREEAIRWYRKAALQRHADALKNLERLGTTG